jgi:predicted DNA-binding transcriptional regulator AlpA
MTNPDERMLTVREVLAMIGIRSRTTLRQMMRRDGFPRPIEIIRGKRCWVHSQVQTWLQSRINAQQNEERS